MTKKSITTVLLIVLALSALCGAAVVLYALLAQVPGPSAPTATPAPTATITIFRWEGQDDDIISFTVSGFNAIRFGSGHRGRSNFIVHLLDASGNLIGGAANCIADCEDDNIVRIYGDGQYYLEVSADGNWFIVAMPLR